MTTSAENYARIMRRKFEARVRDPRAQTAGICVRCVEPAHQHATRVKAHQGRGCAEYAPVTTANYAVRLADQTRRTYRTRIMRQ